jgi:hypothetical protein
MALLAALAACGGGGGEAAPAAPTELAAGQAAQATLGAAGGTVVLATREGARFTLTVPAGAVPEGTTLALETAVPAPGRRLHLRLSPAGLVPAAPLVLTLALPASMALPAGATLVYDRAPVPFKRLSDGSLQLGLPALAGRTATGPAAAAAARAHALAARLQAGVPGTACAGVPVLDSTPEGGLADSAPIVADDYGSCMLGAVNALAVSGQFAEAVRLASALGAYLQSIGAANTDGLATRFITEAQALACTAYGQALDDAAATTVTRFATLTRAIQPVLFWEAAVQQLGAVCPGVPPTRYVEVVQNLTSAALSFYAGQQGTVTDVGSVEYTEAVAEVRAAPQVAAQLRSLQAPAPVQALARAQVQERAQPAIIDAVLQAPWLRCHDGGQQDRLIELMQAADSPAGVKTAAQYCGTLLQAQARSATGTVTATLSPALGGVSAGTQRSSGSLDIAPDGTLELSGPIRALQCPAGSAGGSTGGSERLEIRLDDTLLQAISGAPYLASTLQIDIAQALRAAGLDASSFTAGTLTLTRTGSPCGGFWGESPQPLLSLTLNARACRPAPGLEVCVSTVDLPPVVNVMAMNRRGDILYQDNGGATTRYLLRQHQGGSLSLPASLYPLALTEDGAVLARDALEGELPHELLLWRNGSRSTIKTWAGSPYPAGWQFFSATLNPDSGALLLIENETVFRSPNDLGWCSPSGGGGSVEWACSRWRLYSAASATAGLRLVHEFTNAPGRYIEGPATTLMPNAAGDWRQPMRVRNALAMLAYTAGTPTLTEPFAAPGYSAGAEDSIDLLELQPYDVPAAPRWTVAHRQPGDIGWLHPRGVALLHNDTRLVWIDVGSGAATALQSWAGLGAGAQIDLGYSPAMDGWGRFLMRRADGSWVLLTPRGQPLP